MRKTNAFLLWPCAIAFTSLACGSADFGDGGESVASQKSAVSTTATYTIKNVNSGKCMDISNAGTSNGDNVQQWSCLGNTAQQFKFEDMGSGYYRIKNVNSGKCLDVWGVSTSDGANIAQYTCGTGQNQQFQVVNDGGTTHHFIARHSGKAIDVSNMSASDGANIQQWSWLNNNAQKYYVEEVGGSSSTSSSSTTGGGGGGSTHAGNATAILKNKGFNYVRIRALVSPPGNYGLHQDTTYVVETAKKAKANGMKVLLDLFYSNWWCDPGQNDKPGSWSSTTSTAAGQLSSYTTSVLQAMANAGASPDMVQVGNEINDGVSIPAGDITWSPDNFSKAVQMTNAGYDAVKSFNSGIKVVIHYAGVSSADWWFDAYQNAGGKMDVQGISYYEMWHGSITSAANAIEALNDNAKCGSARNALCDVLMVETAAYWTPSDAGESTSYPHSKTGQSNFLNDLINATKSKSRFLGIFYWGATWAETHKWLSAPSWTNDDSMTRALFDTNGDSTATVNPAADVLGGSTLGIRGADMSEERWAELNGVTFSSGGSSCTPTTCGAQGASCGSISDGCGGTLNCGSCGSGLTCNGSHQCVSSCTPASCSSLGAACGNPSDGCGGTLSCGSCSSGYTCNSSFQCQASGGSTTTGGGGGGSCNSSNSTTLVDGVVNVTAGSCYGYNRPSWGNLQLGNWSGQNIAFTGDFTATAANGGWTPVTGLPTGMVYFSPDKTVSMQIGDW